LIRYAKKKSRGKREKGMRRKRYLSLFLVRKSVGRIFLRIPDTGNFGSLPLRGFRDLEKGDLVWAAFEIGGEGRRLEINKGTRFLFYLAFCSLE
jgi:hypothetical protein